MVWCTTLGRLNIFKMYFTYLTRPSLYWDGAQMASHTSRIYVDTKKAIVWTTVSLLTRVCITRPQWFKLAQFHTISIHCLFTLRYECVMLIYCVKKIYTQGWPRYTALSNMDIQLNIMTSSNGNILGFTGPLCGHRWIPHTKASDAELWCFLWSAPE